MYKSNFGDNFTKNDADAGGEGPASAVRRFESAFWGGARGVVRRRVRLGQRIKHPFHIVG